MELDVYSRCGKYKLRYSEHMKLSVTARGNFYQGPPDDLPNPIFDKDVGVWQAGPDTDAMIEALTAPGVVTLPPPEGDGQQIMPLVMADLAARTAVGIDEYGTPLRAHNGRDPLTDAYQEVLDTAMYLRQAIYERDGK